MRQSGSLRVRNAHLAGQISRTDVLQGLTENWR